MCGARYRYDTRDIFVIFWKFGLEGGERKIEIAGILLRFLFEGRVFYKYSLMCCSLFFFRENVASEMKERIYYNFILLLVSI